MLELLLLTLPYSMLLIPEILQPAGWLEEIESPALDLSSEEKIPLGQNCAVQGVGNCFMATALPLLKIVLVLVLVLILRFVQYFLFLGNKRFSPGSCAAILNSSFYYE